MDRSTRNAKKKSETSGTFSNTVLYKDFFLQVTGKLSTFPVPNLACGEFTQS